MYEGFSDTPPGCHFLILATLVGIFVISYYSFNLHFPNANAIEDLFMCLFTICIFPLEEEMKIIQIMACFALRTMA